MAKDPVTLETSPAETGPSLSASALRMRLHRDRRRRGLLCFRVELTENVINELIRRKRLSPDYMANPNAVGAALQRYLEYTMW
jgi:hypothetical protein